MAPDPAFPLLTVLVFLPALGGLVVTIAGRRRDALVPWLAVPFAGMTLILAVWVLGGAGDGGFFGACRLGAVVGCVVSPRK